VKDPKVFARYKRKIRRKIFSISNQEKHHVPRYNMSSGKACVEAGAQICETILWNKVSWTLGEIYTKNATEFT